MTDYNDKARALVSKLGPLHEAPLALALRDAHQAGAEEMRERAAKECENAAAAIPMNAQAQLYYPEAANLIRALGPAPAKRDSSCWCSDRMSAGLPCLPGTCPNAPMVSGPEKPADPPRAPHEERYADIYSGVYSYPGRRKDARRIATNWRLPWSKSLSTRELEWLEECIYGALLNAQVNPESKSPTSSKADEFVVHMMAATPEEMTRGGNQSRRIECERDAVKPSVFCAEHEVAPAERPTELQRLDNDAYFHGGPGPAPVDRLVPDKPRNQPLWQYLEEGFEADGRPDSWTLTADEFIGLVLEAKGDAGPVAKPLTRCDFGDKCPGHASPDDRPCEYDPSGYADAETEGLSLTERASVAPVDWIHELRHALKQLLELYLSTNGYPLGQGHALNVVFVTKEVLRDAPHTGASDSLESPLGPDAPGDTEVPKEKLSGVTFPPRNGGRAVIHTRVTGGQFYLYERYNAFGEVVAFISALEEALRR